jgi:single-strand DNA-binding protein
MSSVNKVILIGHLGKDPEIRYLEGGATLVTFSLATSESYTKDNKKIEQTEWHNIVMWRGLADVAAKYLQKGRQVYIEGKIRSRNYEDKEGIKHHLTEIIADNFTMLGKKNENETTDQQPQTEKPQNNLSNENQIVDYKDDPADDLPF